MHARARLALVLLCLLGTALACARRFDDRTLYQWTDRDGNVHYTSHRRQIPIDHRLAAEPVVATPEDTHGQYWIDGPADAPRKGGLEPATGVAVEELPPAEATAPVESGPPQTGAAEAPAATPVATAAEAAPGAAAVRPADEPASALEQRIRELEAEVAADQEELKRLIADPETAADLHASPQLREISERLPRLQAELRALRAERADESGPAEGDG